MKRAREREKLVGAVMLITESGKSEILGRVEAGRDGGGGGRNNNVRNGNNMRNGGGGGHVNGKSHAPALPAKRNAAVGNGKDSGPMHAENRVRIATGGGGGSGVERAKERAKERAPLI